ncbi:hypothetical protein N8952_00985 [Candidatus Pelagibacter ubique]|nr:hypothetical protein [Candidatus Pelagibacter ubique]
MKKKYKSESDEIDLGNIVLTAWNEKIKIILIMLVFISVGYYKYSQQAPLFALTLNVQESQSSNFIKFIPINQILQNSKKSSTTYPKELVPVVSSYQINGKFILEKFINEFKDNQELISILKNNSLIQDSINGKSEKDRRQILANFAKSIVFIKPMEEEREFILEFYWHDIEEFKKILDETMKLVLLNLKKSLIDDAKNLANTIEKNNFILLESLELQLKLFDQVKKGVDSSRLQYLVEQSKIAKELEIKDNQLNFLNLLLSERSKLISPDDNSSDIFFRLEQNAAYYMRGYKAINKEIEIIQNRDSDNYYFSSPEFLQIVQKINEINSDLSSKQLINYLDTIENDDETKWVNFDLLYLNTRSLNNNINTVIKFILIGLLITTFYVLIVHVIKSTKLVSRK